MYVCTYVRMYVCMYVCIYIYTGVEAFRKGRHLNVSFMVGSVPQMLPIFRGDTHIFPTIGAGSQKIETFPPPPSINVFGMVPKRVFALVMLFTM